jgi:hypothetical protein
LSSASCFCDAAATCLKWEGHLICWFALGCEWLDGIDDLLVSHTSYPSHLPLLRVFEDALSYPQSRQSGLITCLQMWGELSTGCPFATSALRVVRIRFGGRVKSGRRRTLLLSSLPRLLSPFVLRQVGSHFSTYAIWYHPKHGLSAAAAVEHAAFPEMHQTESWQGDMHVLSAPDTAESMIH